MVPYKGFNGIDIRKRQCHAPRPKKQKMKNNQGLLLPQKYSMIVNWIISCFLVNESWFSVRYFKIIVSFFRARIACL